MKKTITLIILFLTNSSLSFVNAQSIYFNKRIEIPGGLEVCRGIVPVNNSYFIAGGFEDNSGIKFIYLSYLDSIGNLKWTKDYITPGYFYFFGLSGSLFQTTDKYITIVGSRVPYFAYGILIKADSLGNRKWEKEYTILYNNSLNSGNATSDSGYILTGCARLEPDKYSYLLLKTDSLGNQQWYKTYTDNHPNRNYAGQSVIQTPDKGFCLGGNGGYHPASDCYYIVEIIKTDSLGNQEWKKTYGNPLNCNWGTMLCLSYDNCIIGSYSLALSSDLYSNRQLYITKIGLDGVEQWNKKIGNVAPNKWSSWIKTLDDNSIILCGSNAVKDTINKVIGFLFKLNSEGDSIWYREYAKIQGPNEGNELWQFTPTSDNGFAAAGSLFPEVGNGTQDIWVFKTDSMGCLFPGCDVGITEFNPNAGAQMLVYPNPFTNAFAINYNIPKESKKGVFELRDMFGRLVYYTPLSNDVNQLQVVAGALKPGVYVATYIIDGVMVCSHKIIKE